MFRNIYIYKTNPAWAPDLAQCETALQSSQFSPCSSSQEKSTGWAPPRSVANGALIEASNGSWILRLHSEKKVLPGSVVRKEVEIRVKAIEDQTGRKVGKKEKKEISEETRINLMLRAFTTDSSSLIWFDRNAHTLVVDAGSVSASDEAVTHIIKSFPDLTVSLLGTRMHPVAAMAHWLASQEMPVGFTADRDCSLKSTDESKSCIRYVRHPLDIDEVRAHIAQGKVPKQLSMTWKDRISFSLTDTGTIKKIAFLDFEKEESSDRADDPFDANVALITGSLALMIPDLVEALGGEVEPVVA